MASPLGTSRSDLSTSPELGLCMREIRRAWQACAERGCSDQVIISAVTTELMPRMVRELGREQTASLLESLAAMVRSWRQPH